MNDLGEGSCKRELPTEHLTLVIPVAKQRRYREREKMQTRWKEELR